MGLLNKLITTIGITVILFYSITQVLNFYGIGQEVYGHYLGFYIFLLISYFVLPTSYPRP